MYNKFLDKLSKMDWLISKALYIPEEVTLNPVAEKRLKKAPKEFISFITSYASCSNMNDTTWFLSYLDYKDDIPEDQCWWNEYERQCLDAADTVEETNSYLKFWDMGSCKWFIVIIFYILHPKLTR